MKKHVKIMIVMLVLIISVIAIFGNNVVKAAGSYSSVMSGLISEADNSTDTTGTGTKVQGIIATIITVVRIAGVTVAVIMLLVIAMKYMSAAPGEKAEIKKSALIYVVGAVILFAVTGILGIIGKFASGIKVQ